VIDVSFDIDTSFFISGVLLEIAGVLLEMSEPWSVVGTSSVDCLVSSFEGLLVLSDG